MDNPQKIILWIFAIVSFLLFISFYEWRFYTLNKRIDELQSQIFVNDEKTPVIAAKPTENSNNPYYPPASAPINSNDTKTTMRDLFESPASNAENTIDKIKTRYEGVLVNYLLLKKCGKTGASDYQLITSAMQSELSTNSAPERLKYDILTAAKGSYDEIYARSTCNGDEITPTLQRYETYINNLTQKK
jgi:hypothetical protein